MTAWGQVAKLGKFFNHSKVKFGFLETMINSYEYIIDDVIITNLNREAAHAPSYTYSIGFTKYYRDFYLSGNIDGKDSFYFSDSHNEKSNAYSIANINLGYRINKNTEISIWGKNIFNKAYAIRGFYFALEPVDLDGNGNAWDDEQLYLMYGEPLSFGITFRYNRGNKYTHKDIWSNNIALFIYYYHSISISIVCYA